MKKNILITGSNKGIGLETAKILASQGHRIFISGRDEGRLKKSLEELKSISPETDMLLMDVSNPESIKRAAKKFSSYKIKLDVLINNAAIGMRTDVSLTNDDENIFTQTINTNCYGPLRVSKTFAGLMNNPGKIIMVSSGGGSMSDEAGGWWPAYCSSKTLLNALTRHLALELKSVNISVNAVCPGWVRTDMGGQSASRSVAKGAETPAWLAVEADQEISGKFFRDKKIIPW